jgi:hypothetical protein
MSDKPSCGTCVFGEPAIMNGENKVTCRFGFMFAIATPVKHPISGEIVVQVQQRRPVWAPEEWCYQFQLRSKEQN